MADRVHRYDIVCGRKKLRPIRTDNIRPYIPSISSPLPSISFYSPPSRTSLRPLHHSHLCTPRCRIALLFLSCRLDYVFSEDRNVTFILQRFEGNFGHSIFDTMVRQDDTSSSRIQIIGKLIQKRLKLV